jgi:hypothetical protein
VRFVLGILVGVALGFACGWLVFDSPWDSGGGGGGKSEEDVAVEVLKRAQGDNESASCRRRQYPTNVYDCDVVPSRPHHRRSVSRGAAA